MKTTILTIALALAAIPTFAVAQTPAAPETSKPAASAPAKTTKTAKKHHKKVKKSVKTARANTKPAPVKQ